MPEMTSSHKILTLKFARRDGQARGIPCHFFEAYSKVLSGIGDFNNFVIFINFPLVL
jgi:hypothetical protein